VLDPHQTLALLAGGTHSYVELAAMWQCDAIDIREVAHAAVLALAPEAPPPLTPQWRGQALDRLLRQETVVTRERIDTMLLHPENVLWSSLVRARLEHIPIAPASVPRPPLPAAPEPVWEPVAATTGQETMAWELEPAVEDQQTAAWEMAPADAGLEPYDEDPDYDPDAPFGLSPLVVAAIAVAFVAVVGAAAYAIVRHRHHENPTVSTLRSPATSAGTGAVKGTSGASTSTGARDVLARVTLAAPEAAATQNGTATLVERATGPVLYVHAHELPTTPGMYYAVFLGHGTASTKLLGKAHLSGSGHDAFTAAFRMPADARKYPDVIVAQERGRVQPPSSATLRGTL
jgi:hypothetical protein